MKTKKIIQPTQSSYSIDRMIDNMNVLSSSDVVDLPLIPPTARGSYRLIGPTTKTTATKTTATILQGKVSVKVSGSGGDRFYPSICFMMREEGIQSIQGVDTNWSKIRTALKKIGLIEWKFRDGHSILIENN